MATPLEIANQQAEAANAPPPAQPAQPPAQPALSVVQPPAQPAQPAPPAAPAVEPPVAPDAAAQPPAEKDEPVDIVSELLNKAPAEEEEPEGDAPADDAATEGDAAPDDGYIVDGKTYTKEQVESAIRDHGTHSKNNRAHAAIARRLKERENDVAEARRSNAAMIEKISQVLSSTKVDLAGMDPRDPALANVPAAELAAHIQRAVVQNQQIDKMIGEISELSNAPPRVEHSEQNLKIGLKRGHEIAMGMAIDDESFADMHSSTAYQVFLKDAMDILTGYGIDQTRVVESLVLEPSQPYLAMARDLVELSKIKAGRKQAKESVSAKNGPSGNRKGATAGRQRALGPPKTHEELVQRQRYVDSLEARGVPVTREEREGYLNHGVPIVK